MMSDDIIMGGPEPANACCGPGKAQPNLGRDASYLMRAQSVRLASVEKCESLRAHLVEIKGGFFDMGARKSRYLDDFDAPRRRIKLRSYLISPTACSNEEFAEFAAETGYRTVAEAEGWSFVFHLLLPDASRYPISPPGLPWWRKVDGACWHAPEGPGSDLCRRGDHPVVHVTWYDALAYCNWAGLSLPTEAQWERAARGGLKHRKYPWGNELRPGGQHAMNIWQGNFPHENTAEDGFLGTAPVRYFAPNGFGLYNTCGNVWEWTADYYAPEPPRGSGPFTDPTGPKTGYARIQKGGSFLCHESYCDRYHVHSRTRNDPESSTSNAGFRVAATKKP